MVDKNEGNQLPVQTILVNSSENKKQVVNLQSSSSILEDVQVLKRVWKLILTIQIMVN